MLYVFNENGDNDMHYLTFNAYKSSSFFICKDQENEQTCESMFNKMEIIGYVCFSILLFGVILQLIDLYRLIRLRLSHGNRSGIKAYWL